MKYIIYEKNNNKVYDISDAKPISLTEDLDVLEFHGELPEKYDYLTVADIQEINGDNPSIIKKGNLVANFKKETDAEKDIRYRTLCKKFIREKYDSDDENKIQRRYLDKPENLKYKADFKKYNDYVEECLKRARIIVYYEN